MFNTELEIAISPCPNDMFIVSGILLNKIPTPFKLTFHLEDIETLNNLAIKKNFPVIKASFGIWNLIAEEYELLPVGSAIGLGAGPLLVGINPYKTEEFSKLKVVIPGKHTTAHFLFNLFYPHKIKKIFTKYYEVIPYLFKNKAELGILIHEGRFIYSKYHLYKIMDLGKFWKKTTKTPLPLGGIFVKKEIPSEIKNELIHIFRKSILWAKKNWKEVLPFLKNYAQELDSITIKKHVFTYVNEYTYELKNSALEGLTILKDILKIKKPLKEIIWGI